MYVLPYLIFEEFLIAVAFRLWVLRGTSSSVEYEEVHHIQIKCCCARSLKAIHMFMLNYIPTDIQGGRLEQHWEDRS